MSRPLERTHYDTLGVSRNADSSEIRRAYRNLVRTHHPDLSVGRPEPDRRRAEVRIREVNEAWTVLGDPGARREYDRELRRQEPRNIPTSQSRPPSGAAVKPRPTARPASPRAGAGQQQEPDFIDVAPVVSPGFTRILLWGPVVLIVLIGVALFVFTAYAGQDDGGGELATDCVLRGEGRLAVPVDCEGANDGRVVARVFQSSECPAGTTPLIITEPVFDGWVCVETPVTGGAWEPVPD